MRLPIDKGLKLLIQAKKQEDKEYIFRHYLAIYPQMDKKTFKPFEKYYEEITYAYNVKLDNRDMDELMNEISSIERKVRDGTI